MVVIGDNGADIDEFEATVYLHVRGYARAPENHIDIEGREVNQYIEPRWRSTCWYIYYGDGILYLDFGAYRPRSGVGGLAVIIDDPVVLDSCLEEEKEYRATCGGKQGGFWVEFPRETIKCVDTEIEEEYEIKPRKQKEKTHGFMKRRLVRLEDVESVLPELERGFGVRLQPIAGLAEKGYSEHDIDLLVLDEIPIDGVEIEEVEMWPYNTMFKRPVVHIDTIWELGIGIADRLRKLLGLPDNYRVDVFFKIPEEVRKIVREHGYVVLGETWLGETLELTEEHLEAGIRYFVVSSGGGWLSAFGWV